MSLHLGIGEWIAIALSAGLGVWFLLGIARNRKIAASSLGLLSSALGGCRFSELRWADLATAAIAIKAATADGELPRMEALLALERRENCPLWLFQHASGKRDSLFLRAALKKKPAAELHAIPEREFAAIASLSRGGVTPSLREEYQGFKLFTVGQAAEGALPALKGLVDRFPGSLLRVSIRPEAPHLLVELKLDVLGKEGQGALLAAIEALARAL